MTRLRAELPRFSARVRSGTKKSSIHTMSELAYRPTQPHTRWVLRAFLMRVKWPGCDAEILRPVFEVTKAWSCISAPPYIFMTWCFFRHTGNFTNMLVVWPHRSTSLRLSFVSSFLVSVSVGLCYMARNDCSDTVYTHQFYQVYWVGSESVVFDKFWIICIFLLILVCRKVFSLSQSWFQSDLNDSCGS